MSTDPIKKALTKPKAPERKPLRLSSGSSLLNLACTGDVNAAFLTGHYYYLVGDSSSGKTFLALTCLAEASIKKAFNEYRFIYDNAEDGALMDIQKFFGAGVAQRLEPPRYVDGEPAYSQSIEELYYNLDDAIKEGKPFIYILDSMDALSSNAEADKFQEQKKAHRKGKDATGSYGDGKAKINSAGIRQVLPGLRATNSILIVISQTRDNIGAMGYGDKKTRSGGRALRFYATLEIWSTCGEKIKKTVLGKPRSIGINSILQIKKNRVTGRDRKVTVPILYELGIDDVGSLVAWLQDEGHWTAKGGKLVAPEFDYTGSEAGLIRHIEKHNLEMDLRDLAQDVWNQIEEAANPNRKARY